MKTKILDAINSLKEVISSQLSRLELKLNSLDRSEKTIADLSSALEYQTRYTNTLLNHSYRDDKTLEAIVFIPYRGKPIVFKDGKELNTDTATSFNVDWGFDRKTEITINHE